MLNGQLPVPGQFGSKTSLATSGTARFSSGRFDLFAQYASIIDVLVGLHHDCSPSGKSSCDRSGTAMDFPHAVRFAGSTGASYFLSAKESPRNFKGGGGTFPPPLKISLIRTRSHGAFSASVSVKTSASLSF